MLSSPIHTTKLQVWLAKIDDNTKPLEQATIKFLSLSEKKQLNTIKSTQRKREFLLSRALMRHALSQQYGLSISEWGFIYKKDTGPCISNLVEGTYSSLSHSNGLVSFVTSRRPIGIDIENTSKKRSFFELSNGFMNDKEIEHLNNCNTNEVPRFFYRTWCAKEAFFKATGDFQASLNTNSSILKYLNNHSEWKLLESNLNPFWLSIVTKEKSPVIINHWLTPL